MGRHSIRVDDVLWSAAAAKARADGTTVDAVLTATLKDYTGACEVAGVMIVPDPRMPAGIAALASLSGKPSMHFRPPTPPADAPWSRPDANPLEDIRQIVRDDRERRSRPFE